MEVRSLSTARLLLLFSLGALVACSAGSAPPASVATPGASSPAASGSPGSSGSGAAVSSAEQAVDAVARFDSNFLGYPKKDPDLIGQSAWFDVSEADNGWEVTFFRGEGDCPAGCIDQSYVKFLVHRDGTVEKRCEWKTGANAQGSPC